MKESKFINPFTDYGFKLIFGREVSKPVLLSLLQNLFAGECDIVDLTFMDKEQVRLNEDDRSLIYDIYCRTSDGKRIIIEMQNCNHVQFLDRLLFYSSTAIARQGERGQSWKFDFDAVYCVAFMNFSLDGEKRKFRTDLGIVDLESASVPGERLPVYNDKLRFVLIQLPLFLKSEWSECENDFERFILIMKNMDILERMPDAAKNSVFEKLAELASVASLNSEERDKYDRSLKRLRDTAMFYENALAKGRAEGRAEGEAVGVAKGLAQAIDRMLASGMSVDEVVKILGVTYDDVINAKRQ